MRLNALVLAEIALWPFGAHATTIDLGTAATFAVLAASTITNATATTINGNVGLYPGTSVTGFGDVTLNGTLYVADGVAEQAQADALTAYNQLVGLAPIDTLAAQLGGVTLTTPGVYDFSSPAVLLDGTLTLEGTGTYVFQIGTTLTTGSADGSAVIAAGKGVNVYLAGWQLGDDWHEHSVRGNHHRAHERHLEHRRNRRGRPSLCAEWRSHAAG